MGDGGIPGNRQAPQATGALRHCGVPFSAPRVVASTALHDVGGCGCADQGDGEYGLVPWRLE